MRRILAVLLAFLPGVALASDSLVIRSVTLVDPRSGTSRPGTSVVVEGQRIAQVLKDGSARIPNDAIVIDGSGGWLVPGFIDVHVHAASEAVLRRALALGVTTIHLMPTSRELVAAERQAARPATDFVPRIHLTPVLFTGGFPDNNHPGVYPVATPRTPDEARFRIETLASRGIAQIKIIQDDGLYFSGPDQLMPRLERPVYDTLISEAQQRGMRVYVHATQVKDALQAVRAGADAFMHGAMDQPLDDALVSSMRAGSVVWTPAFRVILDIGDPRGFAKRVLADPRLATRLTVSEDRTLRANAQPDQTWPDSPYKELMAHVGTRMAQLAENTRMARDGRVPMAVGSDLGWVGVGTHVEMALMAEAGLTPAEVLNAATHGGAIALGVADELGTIEAGKHADLVLLGADPLADIRNAREVVWTMKAGRRFRPEDLIPPDSP